MITNMEIVKELKEIYKKTKPDIEKRLEHFKDVWINEDDEEIFYELVFCLLTPQSKAKVCWNSVLRLKKRGVHKNCQTNEICYDISNVRFKNKKSEYIVKMHNDYFKKGRFLLKDLLNKMPDSTEKRDFLVKNIKGMGYKEASHFLRNTGFGENLAILDRHILKNLFLADVIDEIPSNMSRRVYEGIEEKMVLFSNKIKIPLAHLDFVMWYKEAGEIFK